MIKAFDRIVIAVPDIAKAEADYGTLLGADFYRLEESCGQPRAWLGVENVVIELCEQSGVRPAITTLVFIDESAAPGDHRIRNARGLSLFSCNGGETSAFRRAHGANQNNTLAVDHLVLHSGDANACIQLFSVGLGIRLALDKLAPQWGGRMLFFRVGKLTLEVIEPDGREPEADYFWGIAFRTSDIAATLTQMAAGGVEVSAMRPGRKPGTRVATLKSHTLSIPTLLIEPVA